LYQSESENGRDGLSSADFRYTKEHEWIKVEGDTARSASRYAQDSLGDIVFVELPKPGSDVEAHKSFERWSQ